MGRVAIVTGGSRGIGAATAVLLAKQGWDLCIGYQAEATAASRVVADCEVHGRNAIAVRVDVTKEQDVLALFTHTDSLGPLSALVNNAGIAEPVQSDIPTVSNALVVGGDVASASAYRAR